MSADARAAVDADLGAPWWRPVGSVPARQTRADAPAEERDGRLAFRALLAFTAVLLISPQTMLPGLGAMRPAFLAAMVAVCAHVSGRLRSGRRVTIDSREIRVAAVLLAWAVVTAPLSYWPGGSVSLITQIYLKSLVIFWLLANVVNTPARFHQIALALSAMAVPLAAAALMNYRSGDFIAGATAVKRITGFDAPLTQNPNDLALMLNLLLPIAVGLFLSRPRWPVRLALGATVAVSVMGIVVTFSRAGFITLIVVVLAWLWRLRRRPERLVILAGLSLALACLPLLPAGYGQRLITMVNTDADPTGSAQARREDTGVALGFIATHPVIGAGIGQDVLALNRVRGPRWTSVHNVYLEYAVDLGLPGLALFAVLLGGSYACALSAERRLAGQVQREELALLASGIRISLTAFAVAGLFHPASYQFYFYYFAGLALALGSVSGAEPAPASSGR